MGRGLKDPKRGMGWPTWLATGVVLLALYVLSVGPVDRFLPVTKSTIAAYRIVYAPLCWLHGRYPGFARLQKAYIAWWMPRVSLPPQMPIPDVLEEAPSPP
jgi:hypothetical protein